MSILGTLGKMAGSKALEKVEDELTKKQNREQTSSYCNYIKTNLHRISKLISDLEGETQTLIGQVSALKGTKMSFREKGEFRKTKEKLDTNLKYLYLSRDFFTALAKNRSGLILSKEELSLVVKFAPYFDGVPVLDIYEDDDSDDSLVGAFKEVGQELKEAFISSKKATKNFDFDDYLYRYDEKLEEYQMPDVDSAIETFKNSMAVQEVSTTPSNEQIKATSAAETTKSITCPNCGTTLDANAKFCLECGSKIEIKKPSFCIECGEPIVEGAKFCSGCGKKLI